MRWGFRVEQLELKQRHGMGGSHRYLPSHVSWTVVEKDWKRRNPQNPFHEAKRSAELKDSIFRVRALGVKASSDRGSAFGTDALV